MFGEMTPTEWGKLLTLGLSALVASLIPALRASSISPLEALRAE
jgi:ABC-type lipoprotein release transport system permease subunit